MARIQWDEKFSVSLQTIDEQHKKLFEMINALSRAIEAGEEGNGVADVLLKMVDYLSYHFQTEEDLMKRFNYPGYKEHRFQHAEFVLRTLNFEKKLQEGGEEKLSNEVLHYLKDWLIKHILVSDRKLGPFLQHHGLA